MQQLVSIIVHSGALDHAQSRKDSQVSWFPERPSHMPSKPGRVAVQHASEHATGDQLH